MRAIQFVNSSEWCISLVHDDGYCFLSNLMPGKSKTSKLHNLSTSTDFVTTDARRIGVLKDGNEANIRIMVYDLLYTCRVTFKSENNGNGKKMLRVEGIKYKFIDYYLRHRLLGLCMRKNKAWNNRPTTLIAQEEEGQSQHPLLQDTSTTF